jgi:hypothetical protein
MSEKRLTWKLIFVMLILSIVMSVAAVYIYDRHFALKVVAVDMKGYLEKQKKLYMEGAIDDTELRENLARIERLINDLPENRVVIMEEVVIRNAEVIRP